MGAGTILGGGGGGGGTNFGGKQGGGETKEENRDQRGRWEEVGPNLMLLPTCCHTSEGKQNLPSKLGSDVMCLKLCLSDNYAIWILLFETTSCLYFVLKLWHGMVLTIVQQFHLIKAIKTFLFIIDNCSYQIYCSLVFNHFIAVLSTCSYFTICIT